MVASVCFTCERCGESFATKQSLGRHLKRKYACKSTLADVDRGQLYDALYPPKESTTLPPKYVCKYGCGKAYYHASNVCAHHKTCKKGPLHDPHQASLIVNSLARDVKEIKKFMSQQQKQSTTTINNTTNNNNTLVNKVMPRTFGGYENLDYLDYAFKYNCLVNRDMPTLLEKVHFDDDHPENQNVRLKNARMNLMEYVENDQWRVSKKDFVLGHMLRNGWRILSAFYDEHRDKIQCQLDEDEVGDVNRWLDCLEEDFDDPEDGTATRAGRKVISDTKNNLFLMVIGKKAVLLQRSAA